jgi:hypothetical protein
MKTCQPPLVLIFQVGAITPTGHHGNEKVPRPLLQVLFCKQSCSDWGSEASLLTASAAAVAAAAAAAAAVASAPHCVCDVKLSGCH